MRSDTRERIVEAAGALFYSEGTKSVGIERVIAASEIAKATLYHHFASKEDLVVAYLERRHAQVLASIEGSLLDPARSAHDRVLHVFRILEQKAGLPEFRGCAFMMAVAENGAVQRIVDVALAHKAAVNEMFRSLLRGCALPHGQTLADQLSLLYDGALAQIMIRRAAAPASVAASCASAILLAHGLMPGT
jgi:AcrR family transcriptional regulator